MKQTFEEADKNGDGLLNIDEIYQLLHKMNVNLPRRKVKQMFQVVSLPWLRLALDKAHYRFSQYFHCFMECVI